MIKFRRVFDPLFGFEVQLFKLIAISLALGVVDSVSTQAYGCTRIGLSVNFPNEFNFHILGIEFGSSPHITLWVLGSTLTIYFGGYG